MRLLQYLLAWLANKQPAAEPSTELVEPDWLDYDLYDGHFGPDADD